ncbi:MAG: hypothetical protein LBJ82_01245 [Deltaproteobacteria bacterium]|jgi:hypothetical protein|nr:hypothetical protein [Deltaproteobacteria bacterium]
MISRIAVLLSFLFLFAACSLPRPDHSADAGEARNVWQRFVARGLAAETATGPFRMSGVLRYTDAEGRSTRVSSLLWGNGASASPYPLRLDLLAGVGNVVAKIHEDKASFMAYVPKDNTAHVRKQGLRSLLSFGVPIPLTLGDLVLLLTGRGGVLFLPGDGHVAAMPEKYAATAGGFCYVLNQAAMPGILELSPAGAPLSWREDRPEGWRISFESQTDNPLLPQRLRIEHAGGYTALIVIREFERLSSAFSPDQLALSPPPDALVRELEN